MLIWQRKKAPGLQSGGVGPARGLPMAAAGMIVLAALAVYHNSLRGPFVYDDIGAIVTNRSIQRLWPIGQVLSPPRHGETVTGRPLLNLSLAINYAISGLEVWSYHVTNVAIHITAALFLFGIVRRTFLTPSMRGRFGRVAILLALGAALMWTVHPLQTESVTYIVQRAESLSGMLYLLTLYCVIRGAGRETSPVRSPLSLWERARVRARAARTSALTPTLPQRERGIRRQPSWLWYAAAVAACLLGMATKEVLVTAPLLVLLYDRTFLSGSFRQALRRRWGLYLGLAATWALLGYLVASTGLIGRQTEIGAPDAWSYARSQPGVIVHYLRLSVWPSFLCLDYAWPVADSLGEILPGVIVVGLLLAATVWGLLGRRTWGFWGAWFLLILAPTSSVLPLRQLAFEHRMYLPLAAVALVAVAGVYALWQWLLLRLAGPGGRRGTVPAAKKKTVPGWAAPVALWGAILFALGFATVARNRDYKTAVALYQDMVDKCPRNPSAHNGLALALVQAGRTEEAIVHCREALRLKHDYPGAHNNLGLALAALGKTAEAIEHYREALRLEPKAEVENNIGIALVAAGRHDAAVEHYENALRLNPDMVEVHNNLGRALTALGKTDAAIEHYRQALQLEPDYAEAHNNLGVALTALGETAEAIQHYRQALRLRPDYAEAHNNLGVALAATGDTATAMAHYQKALQLKPDYAEAHSDLGIALARVGKVEEAMAHYQDALRLRSDDALTHYNLANLLAALGQTNEAIDHYQQALRLRPGFAEAHNNLAISLARLGRTQEAIQHYRQALRIKPDYSAAQQNLARILVSAPHTDEASEPGEPRVPNDEAPRAKPE